ncbi:MAG: hypothetical protein WDA75_06390 [Candidatus Latescibacterota bacterium]
MIGNPSTGRWVCWLLAMAAGFGPTAAGASGAVQGFVEAPVTGTRVPGVEVTFSVAQDGALTEVARQTTDAQGAFSFAGPFLEDGLEFVLAAEYRGVQQASSLLKVGDQQQIILEVYEPTAEDPGLRITRQTLFLSPRPQELEVAQLVQVHNPGDRTFIGSAGADAGRVTEFVLPPGARELRSHAGALVAGEGNRIYDRQPLPPGLTEIAFTYTLDLDEAGPEYRLQATYPTEVLEVYLQPAAAAAPPTFEDLGVVELEGAAYRRLRHPALARGEEVVVPLPTGRSGQRLLKWTALAGALAAGIATLVAVSRRRVAAPAPSRSGPTTADLAQRPPLIAAIARLDEEFHLRPDDETYQRRREALVAQVLSLGLRTESDHDAG